MLIDTVSLLNMVSLAILFFGSIVSYPLWPVEIILDLFVMLNVTILLLQVRVQTSEERIAVEPDQKEGVVYPLKPGLSAAISSPRQTNSVGVSVGKSVGR